MLTLSIVTILITCLFHNTMTDPDTCVIEDFPQTRTFATLEEYQGTRISFNPLHYGYKGNVVNFSFQEVEKIPKNTFFSFGSEGIVELHLENKNIKKIDSGAFFGLDCLHELNLSHNNIDELKEGVFEGLINLKRLVLNNNLLESTPDGGLTFLHLTNLEVLDLSRNRIKTVQRIAFDALKNLEVLNLSYNNIRIIEYTVFNPLISLEILLLNHNYLSDIAPHRWENLDHLNLLNLGENYLTNFDTGYTFSFSNLTILNLSGNTLTTLNGEQMKECFPQLEQLYIENNPWICDDLKEFVASLAGSKVEVSNHVACSESKNTSNFNRHTVPPEDADKYRYTLLDSVQRNISDEIHHGIAAESQDLEQKLDVVRNFMTVATVIIMICGLIFLLKKIHVCQQIDLFRRNINSRYLDLENNPPVVQESYRLMGR